MSTLQTTVCISSSSSLTSNSSSAVDEWLLEANLILLVAIRHSLRLFVSHVVVRHDAQVDCETMETWFVPVPILLIPTRGCQPVI